VYRVAAIDEAGQTSALSAEVSVTTPTVEVPSPMENVLGGCGCIQAPVASLLWGILFAFSLRKRTVRVLP
jgi:hypothetical protein